MTRIGCFDNFRDFPDRFLRIKDRLELLLSPA